MSARSSSALLQRATVHWALFATLLALEFGIFHQAIEQFHTWVYPRWNDQIQYLTESYTSYEILRQQGWWAGLREAVMNPAAQGTLHDVLAVIVFGIFGPSRTAALLINFTVFAGWQALSFAVWRRVTGRWSIAWLAATLLLTLHALTEPGPGSPIDFRLDWMACCLTGMALALGGLTNGFRRTGWSLAFGAAVGLVIVARFLTLAYFGLVFAALLLWLLAGVFGRERREAGGRLGRLILAGIATAAVCVPFLWFNRETVYNYYWIGHLTGPESAIRSPNFGVQRSIDFIFREALWNYHLGQFALITGAVLLGLTVVLAATRKFWDRAPESQMPQPVAAACGIGSTLLLGATMLTLPGAILVLHSQKSHLVVSILLPGAASVFVGAIAWLALRFLTTARARMVFAGIVAVSVLTSFAHFRRSYATSPHSPEFVAGARKVNELADYVHRVSRAAKLATPRIAVDQITDSLDAQITRVVSYEQQGKWTPFLMMLPTGIAEDQESNLFNQLADSDFVFITDEMPGEGTWPYDRQMRRLYPRLREWCESNLRRVESFPLFDRKMTLYQKREFAITPPPDGS